jgi:2-polyprenyl-6-methoxyphenol hydroxylase-like FAD-dependent oxidoreductase
MLIDRDQLPTQADARAGVPQGQHVHALLASGGRAMEALLPGLTGELTADGAATSDFLRDTRACLEGNWLARGSSTLLALGVTRPFLEHHVRRRVNATPNITILDRRVAVALLSTTGAAVAGVRVAAVDDRSVQQDLAADLVVDASGRNSQTSRWLAELGYPAAPEERLHIDVAYSSCTVKVRPEVLSGARGIGVTATPANPRGGAIVLVEGEDRAVVSLTGYRGTHPPVTAEGFLKFAAQLPVPDIHHALAGASSMSAPVRFRVPYAVRRHYESLPTFPDGLVVVGDAVSSFNPIYGQGMSVAAREALLLREAVRAGGPALRTLRRRIARAGAVAWSMSTSSDLRIPTIDGPRSALVRFSNAYASRLYRAARYDPAVGRAFLSVVNLVDPPHRVVWPDVLWRVLRGNLRRGRDASPGPARGRRSVGAADRSNAVPGGAIGDQQ